MLEAFNSWLRANGHKGWSKETFGARFTQHAETVRHGVTMTRPRQLNGLSRFGFSAFNEPPARSRVYQGVRFQIASDKGEHESGPSGPSPPDNPLDIRESSVIPNGWTTWTTPPTETA